MERTSGSTSSTEFNARGPGATSWVALGRVVGVHGMHGQLRVRVHGGDPTNLLQAPKVVFGAGEGEARPSEFAQEFAVLEVLDGRAGEVRMKLSGIDGRDEAEAFSGQQLWGPKSTLVPLSEGEYYAFQLVGCGVEDQQGHAIGIVREIVETGAADLLVVVDAAGVEHLIPAREPLLIEVDLEARRITIDAIPGLLGAAEEESEP